MKLRYNSLSYTSWWLLLTGEDVDVVDISPLPLMDDVMRAGTLVFFAGFSTTARLMVPVRPGPLRNLTYFFCLLGNVFLSTWMDKTLMLLFSLFS